MGKLYEVPKVEVHGRESSEVGERAWSPPRDETDSLFLAAKGPMMLVMLALSVLASLPA